MGEAIKIVRSVTFEDEDWGLGMFDDDYTRVVVQDGRAYLMVGDKAWDKDGKGNMAMDAGECRAVAAMLNAAADEMLAEVVQRTGERNAPVYRNLAQQQKRREAEGG